MRLSPLLVLAVIAVAGCVGQQSANVSANDGIVIEKFTADPSDVFDFQSTTFTLDIANTGGTTARNVEAKLLNVEGIWRKQDGRNPSDSNDARLDGGFSLNPPRSKDSVPGDSRFFARTLIAPNLREGDRTTFPVKARVTYDYTTTGSIRMKAVSFERMQLLQNQGQSVSDPFSESNSDSPVKMVFTRGTVPIVISRGESDFTSTSTTSTPSTTTSIFISGDTITRDFRFDIQNVGSGFPITDNNVGQIGGSSRANAIKLRAPNGIRLERCEGIRGSGSTDRFSIDLRSDGTTPISCTVSFNTGLFRTPSDEVSIVFDFELNYRYFVEDEVSVNVQGTKREDAPPGGIASTSIPATGAPLLVTAVPTGSIATIPRDIRITFNTALDATSLTANTVEVSGSLENAKIAAAPGSPSLDPNDPRTLVFTPSVNFRLGSTYTVNVLTSLRSQSGFNLPSPVSFSFATTGVDTTPPGMFRVQPELDTFSRSITTIILIRTDELANCRVVMPSGDIALAPEANNQHRISFTAQREGLQDLRIRCRDLAGNENLPANDLVVRFTIDSIPPAVSLTDPEQGATNVPRNKQITITFSDFMDRASTREAVVTQGGTTFTTAFSDNDRQMFLFHAGMAANTLHTVTIGTGAKDKAGNPFAQPFVLTFRTGAA